MAVKRLRTSAAYEGLVITFQRTGWPPRSRELPDDVEESRQKNLVPVTIEELYLGDAAAALGTDSDCANNREPLTSLLRALYEMDPAEDDADAGNPSIANMCASVYLGDYDRGLLARLQFMDDVVVYALHHRVQTVSSAGNKKKRNHREQPSLVAALPSLIAEYLPETPLFFPQMRGDSFSQGVAAEKDDASVHPWGPLTRRQHAVRCVCSKAMLALLSTTKQPRARCAAECATPSTSTAVSDRALRNDSKTFSLDDALGLLQERVVSGTFYSTVTEFARDVDWTLCTSHTQLPIRGASTGGEVEVVDVDHPAVADTVKHPHATRVPPKHDSLELRNVWRSHIVDRAVAEYWLLTGQKAQQENIMKVFQWVPMSVQSPQVSRAPTEASLHQQCVGVFVTVMREHNPLRYFVHPFWSHELAQRYSVVPLGVQSSGSLSLIVATLERAASCLASSTHDSVFVGATLKTATKLSELNSPTKCLQWIACELEKIVDDCIALLGPSHECTSVASVLRSEIPRRLMAVVVNSWNR